MRTYALLCDNLQCESLIILINYNIKPLTGEVNKNDSVIRMTPVKPTGQQSALNADLLEGRKIGKHKVDKL